MWEIFWLFYSQGNKLKLRVIHVLQIMYLVSGRVSENSVTLDKDRSHGLLVSLLEVETNQTKHVCLCSELLSSSGSLHNIYFIYFRELSSWFICISKNVSIYRRVKGFLVTWCGTCSTICLIIAIWDGCSGKIGVFNDNRRRYSSCVLPPKVNSYMQSWEIKPGRRGQRNK